MPFPNKRTTVYSWQQYLCTDFITTDQKSLLEKNLLRSLDAVLLLVKMEPFNSAVFKVLFKVFNVFNVLFLISIKNHNALLQNKLLNALTQSQYNLAGKSLEFHKKSFD